MAITQTISLANWQDVASGTTGNPMSEASIIAMARAKELLVEDDGHMFAPVEQQGRWSLVEVFTEREFAESLSISIHEAHRLLLEAQVPVFGLRERLFQAEHLWRASDIKASVENHTATKGLQPSEAALELGLTLASYEPLVQAVPFNAKGRVLKALLEAYRNRFLPRDKIWSTRTSLLSEFIDNFNRDNPSSPIVAQPCDVDGCGHSASAQCVNAKCRESDPPRFVCPAHEEWVDVKDVRRRPPALCPSCASKVREGTLSGFSLL